MKKMVIALLVMVIASNAMGQKSKELQVMIEQIAKLQAQLGLVKKGYEIADEGLTIIGNWTGGEFNLHKDHFNSLRTVNRNVGGSEKVQIIKNLAQSIGREFNSTINRVQSSGMFAPQEIQYFYQVQDEVDKDCKEILRNLQAVTSDGQYEMTDNQRMARIDELHKRMTSNYKFTKSFCADLVGVEHARKRYKEDARMVRELFGTE